MKIKYWWFVLLGLVFTLAAVAAETIAEVAATGAPPAPTSTTPIVTPLKALVLALVPVIGPFMVAFLKWAYPRIPNPLLPLIGPVIGVVTDAVINLIQTNPMFGPSTAIGLAAGFGVSGLREGFDQVSGRSKNPSRLEGGTGTTTISGIKLMLFFLIPACFVGCGTQRLKMTKTDAVFGADGKAIVPGQSSTDAYVRNYFQSSQTIDKLYAQQGPQTQALGSSGIAQTSNMGDIVGAAVLKGMDLAAQVYTAGLAGRNAAPASAAAPATTGQGVAPTPQATATPVTQQAVVVGPATTTAAQPAASFSLPGLVSPVLTWINSWDTAKTMAGTNKLVFLLAGTKTCGNCMLVKNTVANTVPVREVLDKSYVVWYADMDTTSDWKPWELGGTYSLPLWAMIDPVTGKYLWRANGPVDAWALAEYLKTALQQAGK